MSTKRLWAVLAPSGPDVQEDRRLRVILRECGLVVADRYVNEVTAAVLVPSASKLAWLYAGHLLGRGGEMVLLERKGRTPKVEALGAKSCTDLKEFLVRVREGMV